MIRTIWTPIRPGRTPALTLAALLLFALIAPPFAKGANTDFAETTLRGKLIEIQGTKPALDPPTEKSILLAGRNHYVFATLKDRRLAGDEVALKGHMRADGFFQVDDIHTIHHGKLYWIRYYCETCNIAALAPGNCVCCQQPTELQEIPVGVPPSPDPKGVIITH